MHCQNCGQINTQQGNFCRFCGTKYTAVQYSNNNNYNPMPERQEKNYENSPPRPYAWKTDEYQLPDEKTPKAKPINPVQPLPNFPPMPNAPMQPFQQQQMMAGNYRCPRCSSQVFPQPVRQISTAGWVTFAVLLIAFFPLFWIGLLIKEEVRVCPICRFRSN